MNTPIPEEMNEKESYKKVAKYLENLCSTIPLSFIEQQSNQIHQITRGIIYLQSGYPHNAYHFFNKALQPIEFHLKHLRCSPDSLEFMKEKDYYGKKQMPLALLASGITAQLLNKKEEAQKFLHLASTQKLDTIIRAQADMILK